jgi:tetratricopeptide (TPR) repeat protein
MLLLASPIYAREPFYRGLGTYTRKVSTRSLLAQRYFNQGLAWLHGFNYAAALRSFAEAAKLDPECAMAHWGVALAAGPHLNNMGVSPAMAELARNELALARRAAEASPIERALVEALGHRYPADPPYYHLLHGAYADAMRELWRKYPHDADVGAFFAESLMDLRPLDYWALKGEPNPGTEEIIATLTSVIQLKPQHPFANHLYVHALEASPHPERADAAAQQLRNLQPGLAHMLHMPSHIDVHRGRWQEAILANTKAVEADKRYRAFFPGQPMDFLTIYAAHNYHMLVYAALMSGQSDLALRSARQIITDLSPEFLKENAMLTDAFVALPLEVMMRFGKWDEILAEPDNYPDYLPYTRAFHRAVRGVAFAAKHDPQNARKEQAIFAERAQPVLEANAAGAAILSLMQFALEGEILVAENKLDDALTNLAEALKLEDALPYDEPPSWMIPLRHVVGATLIKAGRFNEAEQVYREDLRRLPDNGWSLYGLAKSLRGQDKNSPEASSVEARFRKIWAKADSHIDSSCLCQRE